jgi:hypothetical protein
MSTRASTWFVTPFDAGHYVHHRPATARLKCLLVSLASVVFCMPAGLAWAQDNSDDHQCRPGTHCAPHPSGKPCTVCIPDNPPSQPQPPSIVVVDWRNSLGSEKTSGHEDGTASNPFRALRRAISAAHPGDTLSIRTGLYNTDEPLLFHKTLHIRAENGPVTIYARRMDDILTSTDVPGDQPPVDEQTCLGGLYAQGGLVPNEWMQPSGGENLPALGRVADKSEPNNDLGWDHPFEGSSRCPRLIKI